MKIDFSHPVHLTYCLNVHPGESFDDQWEAVRTHTTAVRKSLDREDAPFGLGLRLSARAVKELNDPARVRAFKTWCDDNGYYVFTLNGFPYGTFHNTSVKADVYRPDWTRPERASYTRALADILAAWLPEDTVGSISTVPLWYAPDFPDETSRETARTAAVQQLLECAKYLEALHRQTGRDITLALEPEPWCALESSRDVVQFYDALHLSDQHEEVFRRRIGVCVDACHCALAFEEPADAVDVLSRAGIVVPKIQLSAALSADAADVEGMHALQPFAEPVYFHQAALRNQSGIRRWPDLPVALDEAAGEGELRVHYHVPLQWEGSGALRSTRNNMDEAFWDRIRSGVCAHLEIETYTFHVLPQHVAGTDPAASIRAEYGWVMSKFDIPHS